MSKSGPLKLVATSWNKDKVSDDRKISHQVSASEKFSFLLHHRIQSKLERLSLWDCEFFLSISGIE
jgi:hypothetical protein